MADREKVIKALERCESDEECTGCPYEEKCFSEEEIHLGSTVRKDAIELLKSQQEIVRCKDCAEQKDCEIAWMLADPEGFCHRGKRADT